MSISNAQDFEFKDGTADVEATDRIDGNGLSAEEVMHFIGERVIRVISSPPTGTDQDDIKQEVVCKLLRRDGSLDEIASAIDGGNTGRAVNRVKNFAIDAAREAAGPGNSVFLGALRSLNAGEPIKPSKDALGQAARRRAYKYHRGDGANHDADETRDIFGAPASAPGDEYGDPGNVVEYIEMIDLLMSKVPSLQDEYRGKRNRKLVEMFLVGYTLQETATILDIPIGTAKTIWRQFRLSAQDILSSAGYVS